MDHLQELARRLAAAAISHRIGQSYQTAYKRLVAEGTIGQQWLELAARVDELMTETVNFHAEEKETPEVSDVIN